MKKTQKLIAAAGLIVIAGTAFGFYQYFRKPADIRTLQADFTITASGIVADYNNDENAANAKYLDKVICVKGKVSETKISTEGQCTVFLDSGDPLAAITCSFYEDEATAAKKLHPGEPVTIKGKCTGKLMDVVLNKCSLIKQ